MEGQLPFAPDPPTVAPATLAFPGKVVVDGRRIAISDSGHHRVLVGALDESGTRTRVERTVGTAAGCRDGADPSFINPQGLVFGGDMLYVADAGSHTVREIAVGSGTVRTLAGPGQQLRSAVDEARGALSSPWDLAHADSTLYVADTNAHRIAVADLVTGTVRSLIIE